jgi:homoserine acetyltransferase
MARGAPFASEFAVQDTSNPWRKWTNVFDASCYLYISRAMDRFRLDKPEPVAVSSRAAGCRAGDQGAVGPVVLGHRAAAVARKLQHASVATRFAPRHASRGDAFWWTWNLRARDRCVF